MNTFDNVLVLVDFSPKSKIAIDQAVKIAKRTSAMLTMLTIVEIQQAVSVIGKVFGRNEEDTYGLMEKKELLDRMAEDVRKSSGLQVVSTVRSTSVKPAEEALKYARANGINMIVIGSNSKNPDGSTHLGLFATDLIYASEIPVFTVSTEALDDIKTIILPLDQTEGTVQKVTKAIQVARVYGSKIKVVSFIKKGQSQQMLRDMTAQAQTTGDFIRKYGVDADVEIISNITDSMLEVILKYVRDNNGDVLMVASNNVPTFFDSLFNVRTILERLYDAEATIISVATKQVTLTSYK